MRFVWILLGLAAGVLITWKSDLIARSMGAPDIAYKMGGPTSFYRIIGVFFIILSLVFITGIF